MSAVAASSLSTITSLAANPPQYPRNPSHHERSSLTLYIARVPGSRDVFLSPLKPREKVVTAEDIASCLYFIHVDRPQDEELRAALSAASAAREQQTPQSPSVRRKELSPQSNDLNTYQELSRDGFHPQKKPLPAVPQFIDHPPSELSDTSYSATNSRSFEGRIPARKPISQSPLEDSTNFPPERSAPGPVSRKAIGTGSVHKELEHPTPSTRWPKENVSPTQHSYPRTNATTPGGRRGLDSSYPSDLNTQHIPHFQRPTGEDQPSATVDFLGTTLTLIRRDPGSGQQWNVARILDPVVLDAASEYFEDKKKGRPAGSPLYLEVSNPGYSKFLHSMPDVSPLQTKNKNTAYFNDYSHPRARETGNQRESSTDGVFRRRMWMESPANTSHRRMKSDSPRRVPANASFDPRPSAEWNNMHGGVPGGYHTDEQRLTTIHDNERRTATAKGYTFISPWNGRCEFSTGAAGNSLKCKHSLPTVASTAGEVSPPVTVSELRFNLPAPTAFKSTEHSTKLSAFLKRPRARSHVGSGSASESHTDEESGFSKSLDRLNLSLGQEMAGGGFGGKRAKLGKLIIEDEGLKMLDLVVAANMSLWWRAYEKVSGLETNL